MTYVNDDLLIRPQELVDDLIEVDNYLEADFKKPKCTPQKVKKYFKEKFYISVSLWSYSTPVYL